MQRLSAEQVGALDPYAFLAVVGKQVIHPGGRASTDQLLSRAGLGLHAFAVAARAISRPAYLRKMAWLMPRMARSVPHLGYLVVAATKPRVQADTPVLT